MVSYNKKCDAYAKFKGTKNYPSYLCFANRPITWTAVTFPSTKFWSKRISNKLFKALNESSTGEIAYSIRHTSFYTLGYHIPSSWGEHLDRMSYCRNPNSARMTMNHLLVLVQANHVANISLWNTTAKKTD